MLCIPSSVLAGFREGGAAGLGTPMTTSPDTVCPLRLCYSELQPYHWTSPTLGRRSTSPPWTVNGFLPRCAFVTSHDSHLEKSANPAELSSSPKFWFSLESLNLIISTVAVLVSWVSWRRPGRLGSQPHLAHPPWRHPSCLSVSRGAPWALVVSSDGRAKRHTLRGCGGVMEIFYIWTVVLGAQLGKLIKITGHLQ